MFAPPSPPPSLPNPYLTASPPPPGVMFTPPRPPPSTAGEAPVVFAPPPLTQGPTVGIRDPALVPEPTQSFPDAPAVDPLNPVNPLDPLPLPIPGATPTPVVFAQPPFPITAPVVFPIVPQPVQLLAPPLVNGPTIDPNIQPQPQPLPIPLPTLPVNFIPTVPMQLFEPNIPPFAPTIRPDGTMAPPSIPPVNGAPPVLTPADVRPDGAPIDAPPVGELRATMQAPICVSFR